MKKQGCLWLLLLLLLTGCGEVYPMVEQPKHTIGVVPVSYTHLTLPTKRIV